MTGFLIANFALLVFAGWVSYLRFKEGYKDEKGTQSDHLM